jgi:hypothetical protein
MANSHFGQSMGDELVAMDNSVLAFDHRPERFVAVGVISRCYSNLK